MAAKSDHVRALARGLEIMRFINARGEAQAGEIARALNIPRPTVYRLLQTLEEEGYVLFSASDSRARVSALAAALGDNSAARSRLCALAAPILGRFTTEHTWPIDLSVYEDAHMVVQETTHARSPLSVDRDMAGFALPMLRSSAGRAYLGACTARERDIILDLLRSHDRPDDRPFLRPAMIEKHILTVAGRGYAMREPDTFRGKTASIAVPIIANGSVAGCVSIIWVSKAITMDEAADRYTGPLKQVAEEIASGLSKQKAG